MKLARFLLFAFAIVSLLLGCAPAGNCDTFGETDIPVCGLFLDFYRQYGGPEHLGVPITHQQRQGELYVQYFQNVVIQYPVQAPGFDQVQVRSLGMELHHASGPVIPSEGAGCRFFSKYSQEVCYAFLEYYDQLGGERVVGQPITGMTLEDQVQVQYFENAKFRLAVNSQNGPRVELVPWGQLACESDHLYCQNGTAVYARPTEGNEVALAFDRYVASHGGQPVYGAKIGDLVHMGDMIYQYYQNACLVQYPKPDDPVVLAPLGALDAPEVPRVDPPPPSDTTRYFPETGHSVILAFLDYYQLHGGEDVFGRPLTEFTQDGDLWVQWFENARFEWHPELPDGDRVQLTPLGRINSDRFQGGFPPSLLNADSTLDLPTPLPNDLVLTIIPQIPVLAPGTTQTIQLLATDSAGRPVPNLEIMLYVYTSVSSQLIPAPETDSNGASWVSLAEVAGACEIVQLHAVAQVDSTMVFANGQFTLWCNAPSN